MALPNDLRVALKEWAVVCAALGSGRQIILLRKGGIYESAGEFEIEHRQFLLFPTYLHQNAGMLKDEAKGQLTVMAAEPAKNPRRLKPSNCLAWELVWLVMARLLMAGWGWRDT